MLLPLAFVVIYNIVCLCCVLLLCLVLVVLAACKSSAQTRHIWRLLAEAKQRTVVPQVTGQAQRSSHVVAFLLFLTLLLLVVVGFCFFCVCKYFTALSNSQRLSQGVCGRQIVNIAAKHVANQLVVGSTLIY